MTAPRADRRLAAILAADVVGYSRLMERDEDHTLERLKAHRKEFVEPLIAEHHGRVVKLMGDGALCEFGSVVDAVACAVAIQRGTAEREAAVPEEQRLRFRIGVNQGDIIHEADGDIYGDGVNIAARLEGLAEPGGICVSGKVREELRKRLELAFAPMGQQRIKNIAEPVEAWRVVLEGEAPRTRQAWRLRPALTAAAATLLAVVAIASAWFGLGELLDRRPDATRRGPVQDSAPSVAVLPFANMSGDDQEAYFADGITDDLITDLAKVSGLVVIARNSTFTYKGRSVRVEQIAAELGVRYVVEGSIRRAGNRIRINAQLTDGTTGAHVWADRYDRELSDIFNVQDEVTGHIVEALAVKLTVSEKSRLARPPTANLEAYDDYLRAVNSGAHLDLSSALSFYKKAMLLDPTFADAYAAYARTAAYIWRNDFDDVLPGPVARKLAYEAASRALALDPDSPGSYSVLAVLQLVDRQYDEAIASARMAVSLGPSSADAYVTLGLVLAYAGKPADAVAAVATALRLDPKLPPGDRLVAGLAFFLNGDHALAIESLTVARDAAPGDDQAHIELAMAYAAAGRFDDARAEASVLLRLFPATNVQMCRIVHAHFRRDQDLSHVLDALRRAGIPEWPYNYNGAAEDALDSEELAKLAFGHTWQGQLEGGQSAVLQIGQDGRTAFGSPTRVFTGVAFMDGDKLCERSENVLLGRARCGRVYRRPHGSVGGGGDYVYVSPDKLFYFSVEGS